MNAMKNLKIATVLFPLAGIATVAEATDYTPQNGTWAIDQEVDGKPGRGFQIDVQNDVLVLYFYGYEQTGESAYWLATGKLDPGSNTLTMDLGAYEGGMAFGEPMKNATYLGSVGTMTIGFSSIDHGEICLPNESCKAISAFNFGFGNSAQELMGTWLLTTTVSGSAEDGEGQGVDGLIAVFDEFVASNNPAVVDVATGSLFSTIESSSGEESGENVTLERDVICEKRVNPSPWQYLCTASTAAEVRTFAINTARNAFSGVLFAPPGVEVEASLAAFRVRTATGREVLPN